MLLSVVNALSRWLCYLVGTVNHSTYDHESLFKPALLSLMIQMIGILTFLMHDRLSSILSCRCQSCCFCFPRHIGEMLRVSGTFTLASDHLHNSTNFRQGSGLLDRLLIRVAARFMAMLPLISRMSQSISAFRTLNLRLAACDSSLQSSTPVPLR